MTIEEEQDALFKALANARDTILAKQLEMSFAELVHKYREVEKDFVARAPDDEFFVLETRRRASEDVLLAAHTHEQPFEVCFEAWNDLVRLGFSNISTQCSMTWFYADCCLMNEKPEAGIAVLEPLIAELTRRIEEPNAKRVSFYREEVALLHKLLTKLITLRDAPSPP